MVPRCEKTTAKFLGRVRDIHGAGAPPSVSARLYQARALPVLGFPMQLFEVPKEFLEQERLVLCKLLKVPMNAFSRSAIIHLGDFGAPRFQGVGAVARATAA